MVKQKVYVGMRVPKDLRDLVAKIVESDAHLNESDFMREAVREKAQREAPELYKQLIHGGTKNG